MKLADTHGSGPCEGNLVGVRVPPSAFTPNWQMALRPDEIGVVQDHVRETSWKMGSAPEAHQPPAESPPFGIIFSNIHLSQMKPHPDNVGVVQGHVRKTS